MALSRRRWWKAAGTSLSADWCSSARFTADIEGRDDIILAGAKGGYAIVEKATGELKYFKKLWNTVEQQER